MFYLELAIVAVLIVVNGLLSMSELAIVSSRPARLAALVERGVSGSRRALALASDPGKFLSTVQIGITLIGVLSGAFSGATLGQRLSQFLFELGLAANVADAAGVGIVVGVITYASLIVGELVPKQIALRDPESVAVRVAPAMTVMARLSLPLVCGCSIVPASSCCGSSVTAKTRRTASARTRSRRWWWKPRMPACSSPAKRR